MAQLTPLSTSSLTEKYVISETDSSVTVEGRISLSTGKFSRSLTLSPTEPSSSTSSFNCVQFSKVPEVAGAIMSSTASSNGQYCASNGLLKSNRNRILLTFAPLSAVKTTRLVGYVSPSYVKLSGTSTYSAEPVYVSTSSPLKVNADEKFSRS